MSCSATHFSNQHQILCLNGLPIPTSVGWISPVHSLGMMFHSTPNSSMAFATPIAVKKQCPMALFWWIVWECFPLKQHTLLITSIIRLQYKYRLLNNVAFPSWFVCQTVLCRQALGVIYVQLHKLPNKLLLSQLKFSSLFQQQFLITSLYELFLLRHMDHMEYDSCFQ